MKKYMWGLFLLPVLLFGIFLLVSLLQPRVSSLDRRLDRLGLERSAHYISDLVSDPEMQAVFVARVVPGTTSYEDGTWRSPQGYPSKAYPARYASTQVVVEQVMRGEQDWVGTTLTVEELLLEERKDHFLASRLEDGSIERAVFCASHEFPRRLILTVPELHILPVSKDGSLAIWPDLLDADSFLTLDAFDAMAHAELGFFYGLPGFAVQRDLTQKELDFFQELFERPENNHYIRARIPATDQPVSGSLEQEKRNPESVAFKIDAGHCRALLVNSQKNSQR